MAFKMTSASDSLKTHGSSVLLISIEDQICLDSIPGWEPLFSEVEDVPALVPPPKRTPVVSPHSKHSNKEVNEHMGITGGLHIERVRRKIFFDDVDVLAPRKTVSDGIMCERHVRSPETISLGKEGKADVSSSSKRPRSLPDFRNYIAEVHSVDGVVPHNGKESVAKEERRLESLASTYCKGLQKDSPVSRSLNSISDIQGQITSFRSKHGDAQTDVIANIRNKSVQLNSPSQTAESNKSVSDKQSGTASIRRSCVRRLYLDGSNASSQDSVSIEKNKLQPSVDRQITGVDSSEPPRGHNKENKREINHEADDLQTSEELFSGSQNSVRGDHPERVKTGQQNELVSSQRTESYSGLKHLVSVLQNKPSLQSQGLKFTKVHIKAMCDVIARLYSSKYNSS